MDPLVDGAPLEPDGFRDAMGHFATGVTVVTTFLDRVPFGTTASAVCSVSLTPPTLLVCMNHDSSTGAAVAAVGRFTINVLSEQQRELARTFATKSDTKFAGVAYACSARGGLLLDGALAHIECTVVERVHSGTHTVYVAHADAARCFAGTPLAHYRGRFARLEWAELR